MIVRFEILLYLNGPEKFQGLSRNGPQYMYYLNVMSFCYDFEFLEKCLRDSVQCVFVERKFFCQLDWFSIRRVFTFHTPSFLPAFSLFTTGNCSMFLYFFFNSSGK